MLYEVITREVIYDAEHFFDGYKANPDYAIKTLMAAIDAGAEYIVLCDTNRITSYNVCYTKLLRFQNFVETHPRAPLFKNRYFYLKNSFKFCNGGGLNAAERL